MSYPDPSYFGDSGEVSGTFRPAGAEPDLRFATGGGASYLATGASTDGRFGLYRWDMATAPTGPGPHFHRTMSESFFVLSGTVRLYDGAGWRSATAGDFLYVPPGGIHGFRNESGEPASMLILFAPGAPREAYFEGIRDVPSMSEEEKAAFYLRHDNIWVDG
ncbi:quercetin dioxygenase-like cupin family protein [Asanoa ferruginea]|uniref:Quercetin dioxygenase-like cupin family protein n=1 Tax=Asanoa ferruginea TaxID=53367 RepID=A0A3D9ZLW9_9ACTN|nr:cupin domain-containing protein [Asanoa ferruginea]REF98207.1 quercetin dioxygenase-like cupin family protein [Asanoa ferruginea]GIF50602.1 cupin [Asanoa ferruginea]